MLIARSSFVSFTGRKAGSPSTYARIAAVVENTIRGGVWPSSTVRAALSTSATSSMAARRSRASVRVTGATSLRRTSSIAVFFPGSEGNTALRNSRSVKVTSRLLLVHHRAAVRPDDPVDGGRVLLRLHGDGREHGQPAAVPGVDLGLVHRDDPGGGPDLARPAAVQGVGELSRGSRSCLRGRCRLRRRGLGRGACAAGRRAPPRRASRWRPRQPVNWRYVEGRVMKPAYRSGAGGANRRLRGLLTRSLQAGHTAWHAGSDHPGGEGASRTAPASRSGAARRADRVLMRGARHVALIVSRSTRADLEVLDQRLTECPAQTRLWAEVCDRRARRDQAW